MNAITELILGARMGMSFADYLAVPAMSNSSLKLMPSLPLNASAWMTKPLPACKKSPASRKNNAPPLAVPKRRDWLLKSACARQHQLWPTPCASGATLSKRAMPTNWPTPALRAMKR